MQKIAIFFSCFLFILIHSTPADAGWFGGLCLKPGDDCTSEEEDIYENVYEHIEDEMEDQSNAEQVRICSRADFMASFLKVIGFDVARVTTTAIYGAASGDIAGVSEETANLVIDFSDLVAQLTDDGECG